MSFKKKKYQFFLIQSFLFQYYINKNIKKTKSLVVDKFNTMIITDIQIDRQTYQVNSLCSLCSQIINYNKNIERSNKDHSSISEKTESTNILKKFNNHE